MPAPVKANDDTREPMRITAIRRDAEGLHITLLAAPSLVLDATGQPLPKTAALDRIGKHLRKAQKARGAT